MRELTLRREEIFSASLRQGQPKEAKAKEGEQYHHPLLKKKIRIQQDRPSL